MKIALVGNPLRLSLSHILYALISEMIGEKIDFFKLETENPFKALEFIKQEKMNGFFITMPYKRTFLSMFYEDEYVKKAMNINCVRINDEKFFATNTDLIALEKMMEIKGIDPSGRKCLIIGNGCAAMTSIAIVSKLKAAEIILIARNHKKTEELKKLFKEIPLIEIEPAFNIKTDILINATPLGMYDEFSENLRIIYNSVIDFAYKEDETKIIKKAIEESKRFISGKELLVMQALYGLKHISAKNFIDIYNELYPRFIKRIKESK